MHYPHHANPAFVEDVRGAGVEDNHPVYLICRSGARSRNAAKALQEHGFTSLFNVTDGFEGPIDRAGQRNGGWKGAGLPWRQT